MSTSTARRPPSSVEKIRLLEAKLVNNDKALEKLTRLMEDVSRERDEISRSLEKLQSQQSRKRARNGEFVDRSGEVNAFLKKDRSLQLTHGVNPQTVEKTCQEIVQLLSESNLMSMQSISAPTDCRLPVTPDIGSSRSPPESSGAVNEFSAEHSIRPQFASEREVGRVEGVQFFSIACIDDLIFVSTEDHHVIKYRWGESGGKISINEVKTSATIENGGHSILLAAAKTQDRVRLYVCNNGKKSVERYDPDSLERLNAINTDKLDKRESWCIAAWDDVLVISDQRVITMYKNDRLFTTVPYEHWVCEIRLSSTFLATLNAPDSQIHVMRWGGDRPDPTPVYTIERICWGLAMSERMLVTFHVDQGKGKLVTLDLTTMEEKQLQGNVGRFVPEAFAREDLVVGKHWLTHELIMVQLS